jgi:hypothetical protein
MTGAAIFFEIVVGSQAGFLVLRNDILFIAECTKRTMELAEKGSIRVI